MIRITRPPWQSGRENITIDVDGFAVTEVRHSNDGRARIVLRDGIMHPVLNMTAEELTTAVLIDREDGGRSIVTAASARHRLNPHDKTDEEPF